MMNRHKLVHIMRAVAAISGERNFVLVGSASVLLTSKNIPLAMLNTYEIDVYSPDAADEDEFSEMIAATIGKGSRFEQTFNYYGDGVSAKTARMPSDWAGRAKDMGGLGIEGVSVLVPDIDDIAIAKMMAWREKDKDWLRAGVRSQILDPDAMRRRLPLAPVLDLPKVEVERRMDAVAAYGQPITPT